MKKNLMSVIIVALCLANLVLSAIIVFTLVPQTKKANELITDVCAAVSLDLNSGGATSAGSVPLDETEPYAVNDGQTINTTLAPSADGEPHVIVVGITLSLNMNSKNYSEESQSKMASQDSVIVSDIIKILSKYSIDDVNENRAAIEEEILSTMQDMFGADFVVRVNFSSWMTQ